MVHGCCKKRVHKHTLHTECTHVCFVLSGFMLLFVTSLLVSNPLLTTIFNCTGPIMQVHLRINSPPYQHILPPSTPDKKTSPHQINSAVTSSSPHFISAFTSAPQSVCKFCYGKSCDRDKYAAQVFLRGHIPYRLNDM